MLEKIIPASSLIGFQGYLRKHGELLIRAVPFRSDGADYYHVLYIKAETGN